MAAKKSGGAATERPALHIANSTFLIEGNLWVRAGDTVEHGHPIMRGRADKFRPFRPTFALPEPTPDPVPTPDPDPAPPAAPEGQAPE